MAHVSIKLNELWSSARERVFGEDYWIPTDSYEVAFFPPELLTAHTSIYPPPSVAVQKTLGHISLSVVQGSLKNEPTNALHHVVYTYNNDGNRESLSIFRSIDPADALDFLRRCEECRALLRLLGN